MSFRTVVILGVSTFGALCIEACTCCPPTVVVVAPSSDTSVETGPGQSCGGATCTRPSGMNGCVVSVCGTSPTTGKKECQLALVTNTEGFSCACMPGASRPCPSPSTVQQTCLVSGSSATVWSPAC
jgi:hypothetical protein